MLRSMNHKNRDGTHAYTQSGKFCLPANLRPPVIPSIRPNPYLRHSRNRPKLHYPRRRNHAYHRNHKPRRLRHISRTLRWGRLQLQSRAIAAICGTGDKQHLSSATLRGRYCSGLSAAPRHLSAVLLEYASGQRQCTCGSYDQDFRHQPETLRP